MKRLYGRLIDMAKLSVVATPIGNLEDITLRALRILKEADMVLCEDTRVTKKLLSHYSITTPTLSYHAHSKLTKLDKIVELLESGKHVALVTDAGTPGVSDPGSVLVMHVREKIPDTKIEVIPGASALTTAISLSGFPIHEFLFLGFLPHKKGRSTLLREIAETKRTVVLYESTHRIVKLLSSLHEIMPVRRVLLARELTKLHEEVLAGTPDELLNIFKEHPVKTKGEFVVIIETL